MKESANIDPTSSKPHLELQLELQHGLNAIYVPEFGQRDAFGEVHHLSPQDTLKNIQDFLNEITDLGGTVIGVLPVEVSLGKMPGIADFVTEQRHILIIMSISSG